MLNSWHRRLRPLNGPPKAYVEPMGNAYSIIEAARVQKLHPVEIEAKYVSAGKDARALIRSSRIRAAWPG